jgi:hypothetical protein
MSEAEEKDEGSQVKEEDQGSEESKSEDLLKKREHPETGDGEEDYENQRDGPQEEIDDQDSLQEQENPNTKPKKMNRKEIEDKAKVLFFEGLIVI